MAKIKTNAVALAAPQRDTSYSPMPIILVGVAILVTFFGLIAVWAYFAPLHSAVHATGEIVFQNKRQAVQHLEGGVIEQILVKDGDTVKAGQPLIVLEDDQLKPIVDMYEGQATAETASIIRLEAEKNDLPAVIFPKEIPAPIVQTETRLFSAKRDAYLKQIDMVKSQIEQSREIIKGAHEQLASKKKEVASLKEQLEANQALRKEGYVTKTVVLDLERVLAEKSGEREQISANIASNLQRLAELEQRILSIKAERVQQAANEIKQSSMKRIELEERVRPSRSMMKRGIIRAPVAGKVVGLKVSTIGGVVIPRETLMEIAPQSDHLIIEAKVAVNDISDIKLGQEAEVTLTAFKSSTTPLVKATVTYISDDRLTSRTAQGEMPYYAAYLELDPTDLKKLAGLQLVPGMQAQASITTRSRTAFDYFIGPLRDRMRKAYHAK
ncbi:MAG: HlyD family type I secretion periplasmic adaptor subunit [Desulfuromonadaceae bacterium]|nr:HlyD family type I secretion periplasmic adaptor subunit [Desulfuromonadaceae bacterium]